MNDSVLNLIAKSDGKTVEILCLLIDIVRKLEERISHLEAKK